jgi:hypothetical protein
LAARNLLKQGVPLVDAVPQLAKACDLSSRQAYRYLYLAKHQPEPVPRGKAKLAFTVKLLPELIQRVRAYAAAKDLSISEAVSQSGSFPGCAPGPARRPIPYEMVGRLTAIGCTVDEMAAIIGVSQRTMMWWQKDEEFRETIRHGRGRFIVGLRLAQRKAAESGNVRMLIWLGINELGQRGEPKDPEATCSMPPLIIRTMVVQAAASPDPAASVPQLSAEKRIGPASIHAAGGRMARKGLLI